MIKECRCCLNVLERVCGMDGVKGEAELIKSWVKRHGIPIWTEPQLHVAAVKAKKISQFRGVRYSSLTIGSVRE